MYRSSRRRIRQPPNGIDNPHPDRYTGTIAIRHTLVDPFCAFHLGNVAVAFKHQVRYARDVGLLAQRCAYLFQPLQRAEDLPLIVGEMADNNVGVAEFP
jgi:hypothetical protein